MSTGSIRVESTNGSRNESTTTSHEDDAPTPAEIERRMMFPTATGTDALGILEVLSWDG